MFRLSLLAFALVVAGLFSDKASAVSLQFKIDVVSSGPSIYACDAAIKHASHPQRVCFDRKTGNSCEPKNCSTPQNCSCVCTGGADSGAGEYRHDYMKATYSDWVDNGQVTSAPTGKSVFADQNFSRLFANSDEWGKVLHSLEFDLGSERYGAEMYLDVCYRGPQIEYFRDAPFGTNAGVTSPNFNIIAQATVTDIASTNGLKYSQLADLKVRVDATCDVQGEGVYKYADDNNGNYDVVAHTINGVLGGDKSFSYPANGYTTFNANSEKLLNDWININQAKTPRFCKVRYSFIENRRNDTNLLAQIRKWKLHKAQICTYTEIQESVE